MEDALHSIRVWSSHGTIRQFASEIAGKIAKIGYVAELEGDTLTCYRVVKQGGVLGIGARKVKQPVMKFIRKGDGVEVVEDAIDQTFLTELVGLLKQH